MRTITNSTSVKWSDLRGLVVYVPKQGKPLGTVEDFFFKEGTNAVDALLVRTRVHGSYSLPVRALKTLGGGRVTIDNENMLIKALPPLPTSKDLIGRNVVGESGDKVGTIGEIWLNTEPLTAMRIAGLELAGSDGRSQRHAKIFTADSIATYDDDTMIIHDQIARKLR
jgi:sporulation protein YlmC with PRC-barrel domain